jgi:hypothetical protein
MLELSKKTLVELESFAPDSPPQRPFLVEEDRPQPDPQPGEVVSFGFTPQLFTPTELVHNIAHQRWRFLAEDVARDLDAVLDAIVRSLAR